MSSGIPKPKVREALKEDLRQVSRIEKISFKDPYPLSLLSFLLMISPEYFLVAEASGKIIGYVSALVEKGEKAHLVSIAVDPKHRRVGVARVLLEALIRKLKARGIKELSLEVRVSNRAARQLYRSLGFKEESIIKAYYGDGEDALSMKKPL
jgi:ribosomal-protein-alanine N-acetyltransferase